jgi:Uma2 family endonuclease
MMTIANPVQPQAMQRDPFASQRFTLYNIPWDSYEAILEALGDHRVFLTYNQGALEFTSPSPAHEKFGALLARFVQQYTFALRIPVFSLAQTTWRRREVERGLEADQCFYVQHESGMRHKEKIDLSIDPPPDLAIEVDLSSSSVNKEGVYAGLRVPELWRYEDGEVQVTILQQGRYVRVERSLALPGLPVSELMRFVDLRRSMGETEVIAAFSDWVEQTLKSRE